MKLLSYHIENYGKIHNQDGHFHAGLTEFCEANGYGKTTMASFIRAMFYGLPSYTTKTKAFDDRQHFYPFDGGKFGGNLTFEMQGKVYKVERFFDKKSSKGDECKVYLDGVLFTGFGEDIGKAVFGLDEESFKKTVFITADEIDIESTQSINEKLNRDVIQGNDGDFETAIDVLETAKKRLKAGRGNNDLISLKNVEVRDLMARIQNLKETSDGLTDTYVKRDGLTKEIAVLESKLKRVNEQNLVLEKWKALDALTDQAEQKQQTLQKYREKYAQGIPTDEERQALRACVEEEARLAGALQTVQFGADKENALKMLAQKFAQGVPTEQEIAEKQKELVHLATLQAEADNWQNRKPTEQEKEWARHFIDGIPTESELSVKRAEVEEYKREEVQLKEIHNALVNTAPLQPKMNGGKGALFAIAACAIILGTVLAVLQYIAVGIAIAAAGVCAGVVGLGWKGKSGTSSATQGNLTVKIAETQARLKLLEEKIRAFTIAYRYYSEAGAVYDFTVLENAVYAYQAHLQTLEEGNNRFADVMEKMEKIQTETQAYLLGYGESGNVREGLNRLMTAVSVYDNLVKDKGLADEQMDSVREGILRCQTTLQAILQKYQLDAYMGTMAGLNELELDCKRLQELSIDVVDLDKKVSAYKEENGLLERPNRQADDADELHSRLSILRKQLADCDREIIETERELAQLPEVENDLERAQEKLDEYKNRHQLLADTILILQNAEKTLKDRYVAPIKERFSYYAEVLERVLDEKISMDSDYHVKFERGGEERSDRHLSAGERSLCALCVRLALIDNMYEMQQPFIVMDDPFVHLDENHLQKVVDLMRDLAKERQIIYFCCHESRSIVSRATVYNA